MTLLENRNKILKVLEYLVRSKINIDVRIEEIDSTNASRIIEILPGIAREGSKISADQPFGRILEELSPKSVNECIEQLSHAVVGFPLEDRHGWFDTSSFCISTHYPDYRLVMDFPLFLDMEGGRDDERMRVDLPESLLARFDVKDDDEPDKCPVRMTT